MSKRLPEDVRGKLLPGSWDLDAVEITSTCLFEGLRQRFLDGRQREDTVFHPDRYRISHANEPQRYLQFDVALLKAHGEYLDNLFRSLQLDGYRPYHEMGRAFFGETTVNVGRDGRMIRNASGLHRLILSRLAGIDEVPVRVLVAHPGAAEAVVPLRAW